MWCSQQILTRSVNDSVTLLEAVHLQDPLELAPCNQWLLAAWYQWKRLAMMGPP